MLLTVGSGVEQVQISAGCIFDISFHRRLDFAALRSQFPTFRRDQSAALAHQVGTGFAIGMRTTEVVPWSGVDVNVIVRLGEDCRLEQPRNTS